MQSSKKMRRGQIQRNSILFVFVVVSGCCLFVVIMSTLRLPQVSLGRKVTRNNELGPFADIMIGMLPEDLAFTLFIPSERAFERDLKLRVNDSFVGDNMNNTYAIVSRVLGFSAIPRMISSNMLHSGEVVSYDSLSGLELFIAKGLDGMLTVNRVKTERVDMKKGKILIHVMDGVIMDAEFEQSIASDFDEGN